MIGHFQHIATQLLNHCVTFDTKMKTKHEDLVLNEHFACLDVTDLSRVVSTKAVKRANLEQIYLFWGIFVENDT
ncbi:CLUMA_CG019243, isoform A [Clunio marinus]|uniref:CLUMA_CG019243, isoform A n=1 Tax=Clunio marinus TaxID=568069 RepID=A0A1J1J0I0_9DIPT|nr:CLUMA_CG019243, isoform A [Clunio marinus]